MQNRSFIIDESNLARNIVEKDYADFFKPLMYEQYSPPIFSCSLKALTKLFGVNEYSLTILSLLTGIGSFILLFLTARLLKIESIPLLFILALYGFGYMSVRYSSELKQYSSDAFLCLLFFYWTLRNKDKEITFSLSLQLAIFGVLAIWACMPIVFILAPMGLLYLNKSLRMNKVKITQVILIGVTWLISFGIYYFSILKTDAESVYLQNFHSIYFVDFFSTSFSAVEQNCNLLKGLFRLVVDKSKISLLASFLFISIGAYKLIKERKFEACLLLLPIILCLTASQFKLFSLIPRVNLFQIPILSLIFGIGFSWVWKRSNKYLKTGLLVFALFSVVNQRTYFHFWNLFEVEDAKSTLAYLKKNLGEDEPIYVHHNGVPAFVFYNELHDKAFHLENYHLGVFGEFAGSYIDNELKLETGDGFWLFFSHTEPIEGLKKDFESVQKVADLTQEETAIQSIVQRYVMK